MADITVEERHRLNELVARAVGFTPAEAEVGTGCWSLRWPDGRTRDQGRLYWQSCANDCWMEAPDFTHSMDAWLAWGLPWLAKCGEVHMRYGEEQAMVVVRKNRVPVVVEIGPRADLPLLLCRLLEKIVA